MKMLIKTKQKLALLIAALGIFFLQSCAVYNQPREPMVKVSDIIQMSKDHVSSKDIISKIKSSHTVYTLNASQLANLQKQGVADNVINYMEKTHINNAIQKSHSRYNYGYNGYNNFGLGWGYGYGNPYFGYNDWPYYGGYGGPTIILRGGHEGHESHEGGHYR